MLRSKFLVLLIFLLPTLGACSSSDFVPEEEGFPLIQSHILSAGETIYHLRTSDSALVFDTVYSVQGVDTDTFEVNWKVDGFSPRADSDVWFADSYVVLMSYDEVLLVDNKGQETYLNLNKKRRDNIDLVAACGNYIYIIRGGLWDLEVYNISKNKMIWETPTGRGQTNVYYESSTDTAYVANSSSVRAFNNSTGELLWGEDMNISQSTYADPILYIADKEFNSNKYRITAFNVDTQEILWKKEYDVDKAMHIYGLGVFQDKLIMISGYDGVFAFETLNGNLDWQTSVGDAFYTNPVLLDSTLYVKDFSNKVYAFSFLEGDIYGYVKLEPSPFFGKPSYAANSGVYLFQDGIVFTTKDSIVFYMPK